MPRFYDTPEGKRIWLGRPFRCPHGIRIHEDQDCPQCTAIEKLDDADTIYKAKGLIVEALRLLDKISEREFKKRNRKYA